jgi:hypothetical protein
VTATAVAVRERPILFSGPMVRAILDDRKTKTRRVMQNQPFSNTIGWRREGDPSSDLVCWTDYLPPSATMLHVGRGPNRYTTSLEEEGGSFEHLCPYGGVGDRLWVRETFGIMADKYHRIAFAADFGHNACGVHVGAIEGKRWRPSIHMPRHASRITLEITGVRVERLQEITNEDAEAEGVSEYARVALSTDNEDSPRDRFRYLWDGLNAQRGFAWEKDPYVWVISFRKVA